MQPSTRRQPASRCGGRATAPAAPCGGGYRQRHRGGASAEAAALYRVDRARARASGGSGLGLSIVKHALQRHGGWLEIASGRARFHVHRALPAAPDRNAQREVQRRQRLTSATSDRMVRAPGPPSLPCSNELVIMEKVVQKQLVAAAIAGLLMTPVALAQAARDYISIVGSSTVFPFTSTVAEQFGRGSKFKTPKVESTGTGGGMKLFCAGVGVQHPDLTNASRRIKA
jgi:hypothetical protein